MVRFAVKDTVIVELTPGIEEMYIIKTTEDVVFSPCLGRKD